MPASTLPGRDCAYRFLPGDLHSPGVDDLPSAEIRDNATCSVSGTNHRLAPQLVLQPSPGASLVRFCSRRRTAG